MALLYGYGLGQSAVEALASDLPPGAEVADYGAGLSTLGFEICQMRPDVHWTNIDASYGLEAVKKRAIKQRLDNLQFVKANVLDFRAIEMGRYDRIFSWYMLPHVALAGQPVARSALRNIIYSANSRGKISLGPIKSSKGLCVKFGAPLSCDELSEQVETLAPLIAFRSGAIIGRFINSLAYKKRYKHKIK